MLSGIAALALALVAASSLTASRAAAAGGDLDETFSGDGYVTTSAFDQVGDLHAAAQGAVVVVGTTTSGATRDVLVARYGADGELDPSFSGDGLATFDSGKDDFGGGAYVAPNGAVLVAGASDGRLLVLRFTAQGLPDSTFSDDGVLVRSDLFAAAAVAGTETGGSIVASGVEQEEGVRPAAVRLLSDGALDPAFDDDGVAISNLPEWRSAGAVEILSDGSALVGEGGSIAKLTSAGKIDPGFGESGHTRQQVVFAVTEIVERTGGEFLAAFRRSGISTGPGASTRSYLVRFSADGETLGGGAQNLSSLLAGEPSGPLFVGDVDVSFGRKSRLPFTTTVRAISDQFEVDESFGLNGGAPVYPGRVATGLPAALTLDSAGRPVIAAPGGTDGFLIIRLEVGDGVADADADGLQNERDRCLLGFSQRPSGCASAGLSAGIRRIDGGTRAEVRVTSPSAVCLYGATIELVRRFPGADRVVARKGVNLSRSATPFRAAAGTGRYYARVRRTKNAVLRCRGATSGTIHLGRRDPSGARAWD